MFFNFSSNITLVTPIIFLQIQTTYSKFLSQNIDKHLLKFIIDSCITSIIIKKSLLEQTDLYAIINKIF